MHYTSLLRALSTRIDYSQEALDFYRKMIETNIQPTKEALTYALSAASNIGNVKMAYDILAQCKDLGYSMTSDHLSSIIDTYSTAIRAFYIPQNLIDLYIKDGWNVLNKALLSENPKLVNHKVLNSLIMLHASALKMKDAEELVLPLYESLGIEFDLYTYQVTIYKLEDILSLLDLNCN